MKRPTFITFFVAKIGNRSLVRLVRRVMALLIPLVVLAGPSAGQSTSAWLLDMTDGLRADEIINDVATNRVIVRGTHALPGGGTLSDVEIVCDRARRTLVVSNRTESTQDIYPANPGLCDALLDFIHQRNDTRGR